MEKIFIKPVAKEIVLRGKPEDGHVDVFSYNYEGSSSNGLGSLFIVGHVQPANDDTSYMTNLVASLAKREYYAQDGMAPKEAFSKTLKKINEVLQDFFRNKDLKVNIGIFAIVGENIFISRLGKFKIILGRDNQDIDILNNINLFNKEHIQEKEFSNIISGKVIVDDKIFAFYPGRSIVAREKNIKTDLLKLGGDDFTAKMTGIKKDSDNFLCAALHITINKFKESAIVERPQPQELREPPKASREQSIQPITVLARTPKASAEKIVPKEELPAVRPDMKQPDIKIKTESPTPIVPEVKPEIKVEEKPLGSNVYYPGNKNASASTPTPAPEPQPETLIRPTEFSSAKKENIFNIFQRKLKPNGVYMIGTGQGSLISKKKLLVGCSVTAAVIVMAIIAKFTFIPTLPVPGISSPEEKAAEEMINKAEAGLESAKIQIEQNNLLEARKILRSYFESLDQQTQKTQQLNKVEGEILATLDQIDKAVASAPSLLQEVTQNLENDFQIWSAVWSFAKGEIKIKQPSLTGIFYPYQDNLYILASDGIYKITDGLKGKDSAVSWLNKDVALPSSPVSLAIDSKVFVINEDGVLTTYYKGDKVAEVSTSIPIEKGSALLTNQSSEFLYLVDKSLGRIYVITKEAGTLIKTLKLDSEGAILEASMGDDGTIYLLFGDNKVWKVVP